MKSGKDPGQAPCWEKAGCCHEALLLVMFLVSHSRIPLKRSVQIFHVTRQIALFVIHNHFCLDIHTLVVVSIPFRFHPHTVLSAAHTSQACSRPDS